MTTFQPPRKAGRKLPVSVDNLEKWRLLVERASRAVHSDARMQNADKVPVLAALKEVREGVSNVLQLKLFPDSGLDFDS